MPERVFVIGAAGLVGDALVRAIGRDNATAATRAGRVPAGFLTLDISDEAEVRRKLGEGNPTPTVVAVPAADTHVDYCEQHPEETRRVNVEGTGHVARVCRDIGARMIFYSSDYVFDGVKGDYTEEDAVSPINEYGRQKAEAERLVLSAGARNLVIRTSGAYGWQRDPKNFVLQVRQRLSEGKPLPVASDIRYNPTFAENLAAVTRALIEAGAAGIFHVVGADRLSRDSFASRVARTFGLDASLIRPVLAASLGSSTPRPKESSLRTDKVRVAVGIPLLGVDEGLRQMREMEPDWREHAKTLVVVADNVP